MNTGGVDHDEGRRISSTRIGRSVGNDLACSVRPPRFPHRVMVRVEQPEQTRHSTQEAPGCSRFGNGCGRRSAGGIPGVRGFACAVSWAASGRSENALSEPAFHVDGPSRGGRPSQRRWRWFCSLRRSSGQRCGRNGTVMIPKRGGSGSGTVQCWAFLLFLGRCCRSRGCTRWRRWRSRAGAGFRLRRWIIRPTPGWRRLACWAGGAMLVLLPVYSLFQFHKVRGSEARAWTMPDRGTGSELALDRHGHRPRRSHGPLRIRAADDSRDRGLGEARHYLRHGPLGGAVDAALAFDDVHGQMAVRAWGPDRSAVLPSLSHTRRAPGGRRLHDRRLCGQHPDVQRTIRPGAWVRHLLRTPLQPRDQPRGRRSSTPSTCVSASEAGEEARASRCRRRSPTPSDAPAPEVASQAREWLAGSSARNQEETATARPAVLPVPELHGRPRPLHSPAHGSSREFCSGRRRPRKARPSPKTAGRRSRHGTPPRPTNGLARQQELDAVTQRLDDLYDDCLHGLDAELGSFLGELRAEGMLENTWVVLTADHGEHFGEHELFGHGGSLYNELTHVPLIVIPPLAVACRRRSSRGASRPTDLHPRLSSRSAPRPSRNCSSRYRQIPFPAAASHDTGTSHGPETPDPVLSQLESQPLEGEDVQADRVLTMDSLIDGDRVLIDSSQQAPELYSLFDDPLQLAEPRRPTGGT